MSVHQKPKVQTLFDMDDPKANKLDLIEYRLKDLQALKDEIMDELDDFMSEVEHTHAIKVD